LNYIDNSTYPQLHSSVLYAQPSLGVVAILFSSIQLPIFRKARAVCWAKLRCLPCRRTDKEPPAIRLPAVLSLRRCCQHPSLWLRAVVGDDADADGDGDDDVSNGILRGAV